MARADPARRRLVASLLIADPATGGRWLIDATPDLREQIDCATGHPPTRRLPGARPPLVDGIFLTHAHMGHYTGLMHLGREAYGARNVPVHGTSATVDFLASAGPWELLVRLEQIQLQRLVPDEPVVLARDAAGAPRLSITPFEVPHRSEYSDTVGFRIDGPDRSLLYIPDIDKWDQWERQLGAQLQLVDLALVDGTFAAEGEIPGRSMADIPHPFIVETLDLIAPLSPTQRAKVHFTHLNHTNPAADPASGIAQRVRDSGAAVLADGNLFAL